MRSIDSSPQIRKKSDKSVQVKTVMKVLEARGNRPYLTGENDGYEKLLNDIEEKYEEVTVLRANGVMDNCACLLLPTFR